MENCSLVYNLWQVAHNNNNNNSSGGGVGAKHTGNGHHHNSAANSNTSAGVGAGERLTLLGYSDQEHGLVLPSYEEALRSATGDITLLDGDTLSICREAGSGGHSRRGAEQGHYRHHAGGHRSAAYSEHSKPYNCNIQQ